MNKVIKQIYMLILIYGFTVQLCLPRKDGCYLVYLKNEWGTCVFRPFILRPVKASE